MSCAASFHSHETTAVANISGRLDAESAGDLASLLQQLRNEGKPQLLANLSAASALDRVCLLRLLQEARSLASRQQRLFLIPPQWLAEKPGSVLSTLESQGLRVFSDPAAAAAALGLPPETLVGPVLNEAAAAAAAPAVELLQDLHDAVGFWKDTLLRGPAPDSSGPASEESLEAAAGGQEDSSLSGNLKDGLRYWLGKITGRP